MEEINTMFNDDVLQSPITSLFDIDFYKYSMSDFIFEHHPNTIVKYEFKNRSKDVKLAHHIDSVKLQTLFNKMQDELCINYEEWKWAKSDLLSSEAVNHQHLKHFINPKLPRVIVGVTPNSEQLTIETTGSWNNSILWETIVLSTINELYYNSIIKTIKDKVSFVNAGLFRLKKKISILQSHPEIKFIEFGTRRRFSSIWQKTVLELLKEKLPNNLVGTSNIKLAKELNIKPVGTMAHELLMVTTALAEELEYYKNPVTTRRNQFTVFEKWDKHFNGKLSIALTDTYGSDAFFNELYDTLANKLTGVRQDSGDAFVYAEKCISCLKNLGIDPKTKTIVFSDGLDIDKMIKLQETFGDQTNLVFGWGTNLTNDLGLKPLSIVMKATEVNSKTGTVKLSDNLEKATGTPENIESYKKIFGYTNTSTETCVY